MRPIVKRRRKISDPAMADDLIGNLPMHLISCILDRIPIIDAAKTSILSKTWRNIWRSRSDVNLGRPFMNQLVSGKDRDEWDYIYSRAVKRILLAHEGPIVKFVMHKPPLTFFKPYYGSWMSMMASKGVKHISMISETKFPLDDMPSQFFSCSELVYLLLVRYSLNAPPNFQGFCNLTSVYLISVTFLADMSFGPQLTALSLIFCWGIQHLVCQFTRHNKNLNKFELVRSEKQEVFWAIMYDKDYSLTSTKERINLQRFLCSTPEIATLILDSFCLTFLDPEQGMLIRLKTDMENMKKLVLHNVDFYDLRQISSMLCLVRSSPNLQSLKISVGNKGKRLKPVELAAEQYYTSLDCKKMVLHQHYTVEIGEAENSKAEILFRDYIRASSPSLKRLYWHSKVLKEFDYKYFSF
ncbi:F-box/FBD/LRR-repeat protein At1g13570 isoform X2 [Daucus carota subsp. sativus]|uniref:F-box/FBD/LRR-repeat protein At1g13570 isoform X2 n=1 Tax=Daucus carota subsp. sativus TaxID=79200 RepID=UPI0007EF7F19|nr:PREDICTED: F-box/FBD/LRR-repeat protein At1g13570-like isoform X2 [Daucus carota subsp. sativus]